MTTVEPVASAYARQRRRLCRSPRSPRSWPPWSSLYGRAAAQNRPAARKPMPVTICAAIRSDVPPCCAMAIDTIVNSAEPTAIRMLVRRASGLMPVLALEADDGAECRREQRSFGDFERRHETRSVTEPGIRVARM